MAEDARPWLHMIKFNPEDPFPLLAESSHTYAEAQAHSAEVDAWLGLEIERAEAEFSAGSREIDAIQNLWRDLPAKTLLTPYTELRWILSLLKPEAGDLVVDLGAAYGRMGFVIAAHHPGTRFLGYEMAEPRVAAGRAALAKLAGEIRLECADLSSLSFRPEVAAFYFLYDYGSRRAIQKTLEDLKAISREKKIRVVGRGRAVRDAIEREHPWLSQVQEPEHYSHFSIYSS